MADTYSAAGLEVDLGSTAMFPQPLTGATAAAGDLRGGKTAYLADGLTAGTMPDYTGGSTVRENGTLALAGCFCPADITVAVPDSAVIAQRACAYSKKNSSAGTEVTVSAVIRLPAGAELLSVLITSGKKNSSGQSYYYNYSCPPLTDKMHDPRVRTNTGESFTRVGNILTASFATTLNYGWCALEMLALYRLPGLKMALRSDGLVDLVGDPTLTEIWDYGYSMGSTGNGETADMFYAMMPGPFRIRSLDLSGSSVTRLPAHALTYQAELESLVWPTSGTMEIGDYAMKGMNLGWAELPANITAVGRGSFQECTMAENLEFGLPTLPYTCFADCTGLKKVWIRDTTVTIENNPFYRCDADIVLYCEADEKPEGWSAQWNKIASDGTLAAVVWGQKVRPW